MSVTRSFEEWLVQENVLEGQLGSIPDEFCSPSKLFA